MRRLLFFGTALGMPKNSTCSSILIEDKNTNLLLDTAGGHEILVQFHKAKKDPSDLKNIFITHYDSDHILGIVPIARALSKKEAGTHNVNLFCSKVVKEAVDSLFHLVALKHYTEAKKHLNFIEVNDREIHTVDGWKLQFFDVKSNKSPQMGCVVTFPDGKKLSFLGDEPLREHYADVVKDCDILIHDAFCLDTEQKIFEPHPKNHSTMKEAAENATKINAQKLVVFHTEDLTLNTRKKRYLKEGKEYFSGGIFVPLDMDELKF